MRLRSLHRPSCRRTRGPRSDSSTRRSASCLRRLRAEQVRRVDQAAVQRSRDARARQLGIAVAERVHANAAREVEQLTAIVRDQSSEPRPPAMTGSIGRYTGSSAAPSLLFDVRSDRHTSTSSRRITCAGLRVVHHLERADPDASPRPARPRRSPRSASLPFRPSRPAVAISSAALRPRSSSNDRPVRIAHRRHIGQEQQLVRIQPGRDRDCGFIRVHVQRLRHRRPREIGDTTGSSPEVEQRLQHTRRAPRPLRRPGRVRRPASTRALISAASSPTRRSHRTPAATARARSAC